MFQDVPRCSIGCSNMFYIFSRVSSHTGKLVGLDKTWEETWRVRNKAASKLWCLSSRRRSTRAWSMRRTGGTLHQFLPVERKTTLGKKTWIKYLLMKYPRLYFWNLAVTPELSRCMVVWAPTGAESNLITLVLPRINEFWWSIGQWVCHGWTEKHALRVGRLSRWIVSVGLNSMQGWRMRWDFQHAKPCVNCVQLSPGSSQSQIFQIQTNYRCLFYKSIDPPNHIAEMTCLPELMDCVEVEHARTSGQVHL